MPEDTKMTRVIPPKSEEEISRIMVDLGRNRETRFWGTVLGASSAIQEPGVGEEPLTWERLQETLRTSQALLDRPVNRKWRDWHLELASKSPYSGCRIVVSRHLPRRMIGHWVKAYYGPRWFARILRFLGVSDVIWWRSPMYERTCYRMGETWIVDPETYQEINSTGD